MLLYLKPLKCGGCGSDEAKLFTDNDSSHGDMTNIVIECQKCKSTTIVHPTPASFRLEWVEKSEGMFTIMK
jgi:hypothetical protein